jgi:fimbrial chaperone protein
MIGRTLVLPALVSCCLAAGAVADASAGVFSVTPVRIFMGLRDRAVAVTLSNEGDTEVVLQADISAWSQNAEGVDELVLTEDLILAPPIIKLAPNARQVVRLALLAPPDVSKQMTYRLVMREVPEIGAARSGVQVPIALALSLPVFITPPVAKRELTCEVSRRGPKTVDASCRNAGSAYAQVREATLERGTAVVAKFEGGNYILPGARRATELKGDADIPSGAARLRIAFDDGKVQFFDIALP